MGDGWDECGEGGRGIGEREDNEKKCDGCKDGSGSGDGKERIVGIGGRDWGGVEGG